MITFKKFFEVVEYLYNNQENPIIVSNYGRNLVVKIVREDDGNFTFHYGIGTKENMSIMISIINEENGMVRVIGISENITAGDPFPEFYIRPDQIFSSETSETWWYVHAGLDRDTWLYLRNFIDSILKGMISNKPAPDEGESISRPDYLTFGDFWNFAHAVKYDPYGVYQPFENNNFALHVYANGTQVNFVELTDDGFPLCKVAFTRSDLFPDNIRMSISDTSGRTDYSQGLEYHMDDPFCFGTKDHPVAWYKTAGLTGDVYEWFRDMLGNYRRGHIV